MRDREKRKIISQSLTAVKLKHEEPRDNGEVKLHHLNDAATKVAVELANFETPWFQSLKLMVEAAGVKLDVQIIPSDRDEILTEEISEAIIENMPRRIKTVPPVAKRAIVYGHSGIECVALFSRTRLHDSVGFSFLVRRTPQHMVKTDPYDLVTVEDVVNCKEFWLFSSHGVLYTNGTFSEFYSLYEWADMYKLYYRALGLNFFQKFRLRKYFQFWVEKKTRLKFLKARKKFSQNFLLTEVELAQPLLAISALIEELENMELLPKSSSDLWALNNFKKMSSATHLSLAVMVENLFKFSATITSGTVERLSEAVRKANKDVIDLDRAPRSTKEGWHTLRMELKRAQRSLKRYKAAQSNFEKLLEHTYYRISAVLLKIYRNQLKYIYDLVHTKPVLVVTLAVDETHIELLPTMNDWIGAINSHMGDLTASIGLALQRAQHCILQHINSENDSKILEVFESKTSTLLSTDPLSNFYRTEVTLKVRRDLAETKINAQKEQQALLEASEYISLYDSSTIQGHIFTPGGDTFVRELFAKINFWKQKMTGNISYVGCCTLSTQSICAAKLTAIEKIVTSIENATQFRLRGEINDLDETADNIFRDLRYEKSEQIGEFADRVSEIDKQRSMLTSTILRYETLLTFLPETSRRYKTQLCEMKNKYELVNKSVDNALIFLKEPSKLIIAELKENMDDGNTKATQLFDSLLQISNKLINKNQSEIQIMVEKLDSIYKKARENYNVMQKLSYTMLTLTNGEQKDIKLSELAFSVAKNMYNVWCIVSCIDGKIEQIKETCLETDKLEDRLSDSQRILDELNDALAWIDSELPDRTKIRNQIYFHQNLLVSWINIMKELKLILAARIREKELKKFYVLLSLPQDGKLSEIKIGQCKAVETNYDRLKYLRAHLAKVGEYKSTLNELESFLSTTLTPVYLGLDSQFYFQAELTDCIKTMRMSCQVINKHKVKLREYYDLAETDEDKLIAVKYFIISKTYKTITTILLKIHHQNMEYLFLKRNIGELAEEEDFRTKYIEAVSKVFSQFENIPLSKLIDMSDEISNIMHLDIKKYLFIKRQMWPIFHNIKNDELVGIYATPFSIESIECIFGSILPGVKKVHYRKTTIEGSGLVTSVEFSDSSILRVNDLFFKHDTDPGFFLNKLEKNVLKAAKNMVYNTLHRLIENAELYQSLEFWQDIQIPSNLSIVIFELYYSLVNIKPCDLEEMKRKLRRNLNLYSHHLINVVNYIDHMHMYPSIHLYKSDMLVSYEIAHRLLEGNIEYVLANDVITINGYKFNFWCGYEECSYTSYYNRLYYEKLLGPCNPIHVVYQLKYHMLECLAALVGMKVLKVESEELVKSLSSNNAILYIKKLMKTSQDSILTNCVLDKLNKRIKLVKQPRTSASDMHVKSEEVECVNLKVSKSSFGVDYKGTTSSYPVICIPLHLKTNTIIEAFTLKVEVDNIYNEDFIRSQLENSGQMGSRFVESKISSVISLLSPGMNHLEFEEILRMAIRINLLISSNSSSNSSRISMSNTSENSKSSLATSRFSERSKALSEDYSSKLLKSKNNDLSLALALYLKLNNQSDNLKEKFSAALCAKVFTSVRITLFERLWEQVTTHIIYSLNSFFYFQYEKWSITENKTFNSFVNSFLLALLNRSQIKMLNSPISELIILIIVETINQLKKGGKGPCSWTHTDGESSASRATSATSETITIPGIELFPSYINLVIEGDDFDESEETWIIKSSQSETTQKGSKIILLSNEWSEDIISCPDFLWRPLVRHNLRNLDINFDISKQCAVHCQTISEKWLDLAFKRFSNVLRNSIEPNSQTTSPYFATCLSHWHPLNSVNRFSRVLKHFLEWARTQGSLPDHEDINPKKMENLLLVSFYWSFALSLSPNARSSFSSEISSNVFKVPHTQDLSFVILTTQLNLEELVHMAVPDKGFNSNVYIRSRRFLISKWLQSVLAPTDQQRFKSNLQLIGERGGGKSTLIYYFDKDHPKEPCHTIPAGSRNFLKRYYLDSASVLIPENMTNENITKFVHSIHRPALSSSCAVKESQSSGYPFLQFNINFNQDWQFVLQRLVNSLISHIKISFMELVTLEEIMLGLLSSLVMETIIQIPKLRLVKSCVYFIHQNIAKCENEIEVVTSLVKALHMLVSILSLNNHANLKNVVSDLATRFMIDTNTFVNLTICRRENSLLIKPTEEVYSKFTPNGFLKRLVSQSLLILQEEGTICILSEFSYVGRCTAALVLASMLQIQYYEITSDDYLDQIRNAIRLNTTLLIFCREESVSKDVWRRVVEYSRTHDLYSLISMEETLKVIDPKGYLTNKNRIKATALSQVQKKWESMKVILALRTHVSSLTTIFVSKWNMCDWKDYVQTEITKIQPCLGAETQIEFSDIIAKFIASNGLFFSPALVKQMLQVFANLTVIRKVSLAAEYERYTISSNILTEMEEKIENKDKECKQVINDLEILQEELKKLAKEVEDAEKAHELQFGITLNTERKLKLLDARVQELRRQTDVRSQLHPLFGRTQATLARLNERDFEEIRTYRAPPISVILVVETVCILFKVAPNWEDGQALLHRENFFHDLETYDKEHISPSAFRKMKQRLDRIDELEVKMASSAALSLYYWLQAISAFYISYSRLKPFLRQREIDEKELQKLQKILTAERGALKIAKSNFDRVDEIRLVKTQLRLDLRSKQRKLESELKETQTFLANLKSCNLDGRETKKHLEKSLKFFNLEVLVSSIYVFLILRFEPNKAKELLQFLFNLDEEARMHLQLLLNRKLLISKFTGKIPASFQGGINDVLQILKDEKVEYEVAAWSKAGNAVYDKVIICRLEDELELKQDFIERFSKAAKLLNTHKVLRRDHGIIEEEIRNFDLRFYESLTCPNYDYNYLKNLVAKRKKTREEWNAILDDTKSMIKSSTVFDIAGYAIEAISIFNHINGNELPSRVSLVQKSIDCMDELTYSSCRQFIGTFISSLFNQITAYCSDGETENFKKHFVIYVLSLRTAIDRDLLVKYLIFQQEIDLAKYSALLEDIHIQEYFGETQFSPFIKFWKYPDLEATDMIILYKIRCGCPFSILYKIAFGGFNLTLKPVKLEQIIIPLNSIDERETYSLSHVLSQILPEDQDLCFSTKQDVVEENICLISLEERQHNLLQKYNIIHDESCIEGSTYSGLPLYMKHCKKLYNTTSSTELVFLPMLEWVKHNNVFNSVMEYGVFYILLNTRDNKAIECCLNDINNSEFAAAREKMYPEITRFLRLIGVKNNTVT